MASEAVKVIVRCRPMNEREKALGCKAVVSMESARGQCFLQNPAAAGEPPKQFTFDGAYYQEHNTEQIYNEIAYPLVEGVTEGYNGTIFAYGQTGSGKSFTMQGIVAPSTQKGIIPRAFEHIFESVQCAENAKFLVRASYLEIYNEDIRDLLGADTKQKLELKEHPEKGVYVKGLSLHTVHSVVQCERIMETGWRNRAVGYTLMNKDSSRSHSIFTVNMEIYTVAAVRTETTPDETPLPEDSVAAADEEPASAQDPAAPGTAQDAGGASRGSAGAEVAVTAEGISLPADQQQVLARLQMLERQVVGGEQAENKDLKEKRKRRKKYADERRMQLAAALQQSNEDSSDWVLLNVYDSIQEEVRAKSKLLEKMQKKLRAAETEIQDLQSEFELEKIDYLGTIRRLERDLMLFQQLLDQVQSLVRRDCNYSNLEKIKRESVWDEENGCWKIPEPVIQKTRLPAAVPALPRPKPARTSPPADSGELTPEEDRYKLALHRRDSETIASNYFRPTRASRILHPDPTKDRAPPGAPSAAPARPRPFRLQALALAPPHPAAKPRPGKAGSGSRPL